MLVPMEGEKEKEDKQDSNERTAGILNGDIGDGHTGQEDEGSSPQADWTGTESHAGNEDSAGTETELGQREDVAEHKVRAPLLCASMRRVVHLQTCHACCLDAPHGL